MAAGVSIKFPKRPIQGETDLNKNPALEIPNYVTMALWTKDHFNVNDIPVLKTQPT